MDDKEYYSLMNRTSRFVINNTLNNIKKKSSSDKDNKSGTEQVNTQNQDSYKNLETRQGKADAEMLMEKKNN